MQIRTVHTNLDVVVFCQRHSHYPANTKHLYIICTKSVQRLRRWSNIVQMLYKCLLFTGYDIQVIQVIVCTSTE